MHSNAHHGLLHCEQAHCEDHQIQENKNSTFAAAGSCHPSASAAVPCSILSSYRFPTNKGTLWRFTKGTADCKPVQDVQVAHTAVCIRGKILAVLPVQVKL